MQQFIKYLCVEDNAEWRRLICRTVQDYFRTKKRFDAPCIVGIDTADGAAAYQALIQGAFDLALLDLNLGPTGAAQPVSGLDVLTTIGQEKRAFFVIIITGAPSDESIEVIYGKEVAEVLRFGAFPAAIKLFPPQRVCIVNKPDGDPTAAMARIRRHIETALDHYCAASRMRNVFRPAPHEPAMWQIAFDGSPIIPVKGIPAMGMIRALLGSPHHDWSVVDLIQKLADQSGHETVRPDLESREEGSGHRQGRQADETAFHSQLSVGNDSDRPITDDIIQNLFKAYLGDRLDEACAAWIPVAGMNTMATIPGRITDILRTKGRAEGLVNHDGAAATLRAMRDALTPLLAKHRAAGAPAQGKMSVGQGVDIPQLGLARQYWKRFTQHIEGYKELGPFLDHVREFIPRGKAERGRIQYDPPGGARFQPFWLTD